MKGTPAPRDLVVLVADKNMEEAIRGLLSRAIAFGIRQPDFEILRHPATDSGCLGDAHSFLRASSCRYEHALVMLDRDGCGKETLPRTELELEIEQRLACNGWNDRAAAIVIEPELEIWIWSNSPVVDTAVGWPIGDVRLRDALVDAGFLLDGATKPADPKGAMEYALGKSKIPRSSAIYGRIAQKTSFRRCEDPSFLKFKEKLQSWFPVRD